jgi:membrane peptidoglycan carboxypeptidase
MEEVLSKDRILELYLNCIEYGPDLYGIGPAAEHYFKKPASRLTPLQSSFLAAIKPAPWYGARFLERRRTPKSGWWQTRLQYIMERLHEKGFITEEALLAAAPYVVYFPR